MPWLAARNGGLCGTAAREMPLWERKRKKQQSQGGARFRAPAEWQEMLKELDEQHGKHQRLAKRKKHLRRQRHIDDFRELRLDGTKPEGFSEALLDLTADAYARRDPLSEGQRYLLKGHPGAGKGFDSDEDARKAADRAAAKHRRVMRQKGIRDDGHYYRPSERGDTGEVDRTYQVDGGKGQ